MANSLHQAPWLSEAHRLLGPVLAQAARQADICRSHFALSYTAKKWLKLFDASAPFHRRFPFARLPANGREYFSLWTV
jgi:hypothetical protein